MLIISTRSEALQNLRIQVNNENSQQAPYLLEIAKQASKDNELADLTTNSFENKVDQLKELPNRLIDDENAFVNDHSINTNDQGTEKTIFQLDNSDNSIDSTENHKTGFSHIKNDKSSNLLEKIIETELRNSDANQQKHLWNLATSSSHLKKPAYLDGQQTHSLLVDQKMHHSSNADLIGSDGSVLDVGYPILSDKEIYQTNDASSNVEAVTNKPSNTVVPQVTLASIVENFKGSMNNSDASHKSNVTNRANFNSEIVEEIDTNQVRNCTNRFKVMQNDQMNDSKSGNSANASESRFASDLQKHTDNDTYTSPVENQALLESLTPLPKSEKDRGVNIVNKNYARTRVSNTSNGYIIHEAPPKRQSVETTPPRQVNAVKHKLSETNKSPFVRENHYQGQAPDRLIVDDEIIQRLKNANDAVVYNNTRQKAVTPIVKDPHCVGEENLATFEHPDACDKYYICENGRYIERTCPNGLMYGTRNIVRASCVHRWHANCGSKSVPNPISSPGCRWQNGIFNVEDSPRCTPDYYECIDGHFFVRRCEIEGQMYDERTKTCGWAEGIGCSSDILGFQCPPNDKENTYWPFPRYFLNNNSFITCINEKPKVFRCRETERVHVEELYCITTL